MAISIIIGILSIVLIYIWFIYRNNDWVEMSEMSTEYYFEEKIREDTASFLFFWVWVSLCIGLSILLTKFYLVLTDYGIKSLGQNLYVVRNSFWYW